MPDIVDYEYIKNRNINKTTLIDVRNPNELIEDGSIPHSINIPLSQVSDVFANVTAEHFLSNYGYAKPAFTDEVILSCKLGGRAKQAVEILIKLGFKNVKYYKGSFQDWKMHQN